MRRLYTQLCWVILFAGTHVTAMELPKPGRDFAEISKELDVFALQAAHYALPLLLRDEKPRLQQAKIAFDAKSYWRALWLLLPLGNRPDTLPMLAESSFQIGLNDAAADYFRELGDYGRLMEVDDRLALHEQLVKDYTSYVAQRSVVPSHLRYLYGKTLFLTGHDEQAQVELSTIDTAQSQYIIAAAYVRQGQLDVALEIFKNLSKRVVHSLDERSVKDLSILGAARILFQQHKNRDAVVWYQKIPLDSDYLTQTRVELTTAYIAYGDQLRAKNLDLAKTAYAGAISNLYRLIKAGVQKDIRLQVLYADLLERLNRPERATELYNRVKQEANSLLNSVPKSSLNIEQEIAQAKQDQNTISQMVSNFSSNLSLEIVPHQQGFTNALARLNEIKGYLAKYEAPVVDGLSARTSELVREFESIRSREEVSMKGELQEQLASLNLLSPRLDKLTVELTTVSEKMVEAATAQQGVQAMKWLRRADLGLLNMKLSQKRNIDTKIAKLEKAQAKELVALDAEFAGETTTNAEIQKLKDEVLSTYRERLVRDNEAELKPLLDEDGRIRKEAIAELQKFTTPNALLVLGELYMQDAERESIDSPDYTKAIEIFQKMGSADVYYLLGVCFVEMDRYHEAIVAWEKLLTEFPQSDLVDETLFRLGDEYFSHQQWNEAIRAYKQLTEKPESIFYSKAIYKLAWADYLTNRYADAIAGFSKVLDLGAASILASESQQYMALSFLDGEADNAVEGMKAYFASIGGRPYERVIAIELADALAKMARYDEAAQAIKYALAIDPNDQELAIRLVQFAVESGSLQAAMREREQFILQYKSGPLVRDQLRILMNYEHSQAHYEKAAELYALYVNTFMAADDVPQILYLLAEAAFQAHWYDDAAVAFEQTHHWFDVVYARRAQIEHDFDLATIKPEKKGSLQGAMPVAMMQFITAVDVLSQRVPDSSELPAFLFECAGIYYAYGDWDQAQTRLADIVARYPALPVAKLSADLLLDDSVTKNDWITAAKDAARFKQAQIGGVSKDFESIEMSARFKEAQALFADAEKTMTSGDIASARGQYELAAARYLLLLHDDPKSEFADKMLYNAGIALDLAQKPEEAEHEFNRLMHDYPQSPLAEKALLARATRFEQSLELSKAAHSYLKFAQMYPKSTHAANALNNAALFLEALAEFKQAAQIFEKLGTPDTILRAAALYEKIHDVKERNRVLTKFVTQNRHDAERMPAVIQADVELGAYEDALSLFKKHPDSEVSAYYASKAQYILLDAERKKFEAIKISAKSGKAQGDQLKTKTALLSELKKKYEAIVLNYGLSKWTVASLYQIGSLYENLFRAMLAAPCPADVEKIDESACDEYKSLLEDKAMVLETKAIDAYKLTREQSRQSPDASEWTFVAEDALHKLKPSEFSMSIRPLVQPLPVVVSADLEKSARERLEVNSKDMQARLDMAKVFYGETKYEAAKMVLEDSLEIDPNQATTYEWLGYTLRALNDTKAAVAAFEKAVSLDATLFMARDSLGLLLLSRGELDRGLVMLTEAFSAMPESALVHLHLGNANLLLGRNEEAKTRYDEVIRLDPELVDAYYNLALTCQVLEQLENAKTNWLHYIEKSSDEVLKKRAQSYLTMVERKIQIETLRRAREKETQNEEAVDVAPAE